MNYPKEAIAKLLERYAHTYDDDIRQLIDYCEHFRPRLASEEKPEEGKRVLYWNDRHWLGADGKQVMAHEYWFPAPSPPLEPTAVDRLWDSMKPALVSPDLREIMGHRLTKQELNIIIDQYEKVKGTK